MNSLLTYRFRGLWCDHSACLDWHISCGQRLQARNCFLIIELEWSLVILQVVFLDDDVVVQRDLTDLFSLDLHDNVNGAVETCLESFHRFHKYLNFSHPKIKANFNPNACGWAFGMNVFDLIRWREKKVTAQYHYWQEQNVDRTLWKLGTLPAGLLTFYGLVEPLDRKWHILGLGYDANIDADLIESGAVVHYNGNMKPWLKLAMSRYKPLWERYINYQSYYLQQCNFHWNHSFTPSRGCYPFTQCWPLSFSTVIQSSPFPKGALMYVGLMWFLVLIGHQCLSGKRQGF